MTSNLWFPFAWSDEGVGQHRFGTGSVWCTRTGSYVWLQNCFLTMALFSLWGCAARLSLGCPQGAAVSCVFGRRCKHISRWNKEWQISTGPSVYACIFSPHIVWTRDCATVSFSEIMICHSQFWWAKALLSLHGFLHLWRSVRTTSPASLPEKPGQEL